MDILYGVIIVATLGGATSIINAAAAWLRALSSGESLTGVLARLALTLGLRTVAIVGPAAMICPTAPEGALTWIGHQALWTIIAAAGLTMAIIVEKAASAILRRTRTGAPADITDPAELYSAKRTRAINGLSLRHHRAVMAWTEAGSPGGGEVVAALDDALRYDVTQHATVSEYEHAVANLETAVRQALDTEDV